MRLSKAGQPDYKLADWFINWWPVYKLHGQVDIRFATYIYIVIGKDKHLQCMCNHAQIQMWIGICGGRFACCCFDSVFFLLVLTAGPEEVCVWRMVCVLRSVISIPEYSISINAHLTDIAILQSAYSTACMLDWCSHLRGLAVAYIVMCWSHYHGHVRVW